MNYNMNEIEDQMSGSFKLCKLWVRKYHLKDSKSLMNLKNLDFNSTSALFTTVIRVRVHSLFKIQITETYHRVESHFSTTTTQLIFSGNRPEIRILLTRG